VISLFGNQKEGDMQRNLMGKLVQWKSDKNRKPLIIRGARQVGKTWLMKKFAEDQYKEVIYISFDEQTIESKVFEDTKSASQIIDQLQIIRSKKFIPNETIIILDEIQESVNALGSLKYFCENAREYHVIAAGSLLGTYLSKPMSYPVGKVNIMTLFPFSFDEFLRESHPGYGKYYDEIEKPVDIVPTFHDDLLKIYREYLIVGGMPECVYSWINERDSARVIEIQKEIITLYENDFTKHHGTVNAARILQVFRSIPGQLAKENNGKFVYGAVKQGGRARDFEDAIQWLVAAGIVNQIHNVSSPQIPLKPYEKLEHFKLYMLDTGLLKQMSNIPNSFILLNESYSFKGQLNENYVLQQLICQLDYKPNYLARSNDFEIDFLVQDKDNIIPIEVKSGKGKKATSFKRYIAEYNPEISLRFSTNGFVKDGKITNIPLPYVGKILQLISD
jgi:predicted AAA+ superfamily ATPase